MNLHCLFILFISGVIYKTCALSIGCGEFYDDDTVSKIWGYEYYSCNGTVVADVSDNRVMELFGKHLHGRNSSYTERFILNYQNLSSFPTNFQIFFPYLSIIDFSYNYIDSVKNYQLQPYKRLRSLILEHNKISTLDSNLFDGLDQLIEVRLNDNHIKHVGYDIKLPRYFYMDTNPCIPSCCSMYNMNKSILELLRNQCQPLQSAIGQSGNFSHDIDAVSGNIVDHTQEKDVEPATEEPSIDTKRPKLGELMHCVFAILLRENDEPLGKRCTEMYYSEKYSSLHDSVQNIKTKHPNYRSEFKKEFEMKLKNATVTPLPSIE